MKMVVAYVDPERFEDIREDLLALGIVSISVLNASGSTPEATVTGTYRGAKIEQHLRRRPGSRPSSPTTRPRPWSTRCSRRAASGRS